MISFQLWIIQYAGSGMWLYSLRSNIKLEFLLLSYCETIVLRLCAVTVCPWSDIKGVINCTHFGTQTNGLRHSLSLCTECSGESDLQIGITSFLWRQVIGSIYNIFAIIFIVFIFYFQIHVILNPVLTVASALGTSRMSQHTSAHVALVSLGTGASWEVSSTLT